jgi:glycerol-3-phosphate acyltransferase PlsY
MSILYILIAVIAAYILGSIPSAVWAGRLFHGIDVREHGSGNAGATNVIRVLALLVNLQILTGFAAIIGHIFPVFAGFRGGKGVATMFGILAAIHPAVTLVCLGVFLVVFLITGIVSVASMTAGIAFPVFLLTVFDTPSLLFKIFSVFVAIALLITHRKNIRRLLKGEEKKLFGKKPKSESDH